MTKEEVGFVAIGVHVYFRSGDRKVEIASVSAVSAMSEAGRHFWARKIAEALNEQLPSMGPMVF